MWKAESLILHCLQGTLPDHEGLGGPGVGADSGRVGDDSGC